MKLFTAKKLTVLLGVVLLLVGLTLPVTAGSDDGFNDVELLWPCEGHVYDNACDTRCNVCLTERTIQHTYSSDTDVICNVCDAYRIVITTDLKTAYAQLDAKATFKVAAKGDGLKYAWYFKNAGSTVVNKSSVTTATYSTTLNKTTKNRQFYCVVTDKHGNKVQSKTAYLRESVSITTDLKTTYAKMGAKATFKVTASGDGLKYAWYVKNAGASKFTKVTTTTASFAVTLNSTNKNRQVYCVVTDKYGNEVRSKTVYLREAASVKTDLKTAYAKMGATAKFTVKASGDSLKYAWYVKNAGASKFTKVTTTTSTLSVKLSSTTKNRQVYCVVTDKYGNKAQSKTVYLREATSVTTQPKTTYAKKNATAKVTVKASGDGLKYAWYYKNAGASKFTKASATTATYSVKLSSTTKNRQVYCVVTDKYGNKVTSKTVYLREAVSVTTQPKTVTVAKNATAKVSVKASGDGLKYTWYYKNAGASKYTKASTTSASYSVKMTATAKNRKVYCVVTDKYGKTVQTVTVTLKMK